MIVSGGRGLMRRLSHAEFISMNRTFATQWEDAICKWEITRHGICYYLDLRLASLQHCEEQNSVVCKPPIHVAYFFSSLDYGSASQFIFLEIKYKKKSLSVTNPVSPYQGKTRDDYIDHWLWKKYCCGIALSN